MFLREFGHRLRFAGATIAAVVLGPLVVGSLMILPAYIAMTALIGLGAVALILVVTR